MKLLLTMLLTLMLVVPVAAREACTLIVAVDDGREIVRIGPNCATEFSPASTFKLALALMGFDSGLLESSEAPAIAYDPVLNAPYPGWRITVTPRIWLKNSVVWYSQALTRQLGIEQFQAYVDLFDYGNRDLSGDRGRNNGLTEAWLGSSLKISPDRQVAFLREIWLGQVRVSDSARTNLFETAEWFEAGDGWMAQAKTGTAFLDNPDPSQLGWFAGWLHRGGETFAFARLYIDMPPQGFAGSIVRDLFLSEVATLMDGST